MRFLKAFEIFFSCIDQGVGLLWGGRYLLSKTLFALIFLSMALVQYAVATIVLYSWFLRAFFVSLFHCALIRSKTRINGFFFLSLTLLARSISLGHYFPPIDVFNWSHLASSFSSLFCPYSHLWHGISSLACTVPGLSSCLSRHTIVPPPPRLGWPAEPSGFTYTGKGAPWRRNREELTDFQAGFSRDIFKICF